MKLKFLFLECLFVAAIQLAVAQNSTLTIFSEDGDNFTLFVNGERKNNSPATNVKSASLSGDGCKVRIVFQNPTLPEISKFLMLTANEETTFGITKNKKGGYALRLVSTAPVTAQEHSVNNGNGNAAPRNRGSDEVMTTTTKTASSGNASPQNTTSTSDNVSMKMSASNGDNVNFSMSVNVSAEESKPKDNAQNATVSVNIKAPAEQNTEAVTTTTTTTSNSNQAVSNRNCEMSNSDYQNALSSIQSKTFADTRMSVARQALKNHCVTVQQVKGMVELFTFENDKLDFLKHAYPYTSDKENYYTLGNVFTHESTVEELNEFLESQQ